MQIQPRRRWQEDTRAREKRGFLGAKVSASRASEAMGCPHTIYGGLELMADCV